ncbi:MAG: universal stress protein [Sphingomonadaceae bacterium]|nr:universal stress protein [Sphingomonadaceae bacterium]
MAGHQIPTAGMIDTGRFNILLCIDGSEESWRGLNYAVKLGQGNDANITLLYVRPVDNSLLAGVDLARRNMLEWGVELPGMRALKAARERLVELGYLGGSWSEETVREQAFGDPVGDTMIVYTNDDGAMITLKLMVSPSVAAGILDECEINPYDIVIIAMGGEEGQNFAGKINWSVTRTVALESSQTVLLAREIEENHGHLICIRSENSIAAARKDAVLANRCNCPIYLMSVAENDGERAMAEEMLARAKTEIEAAGVEVQASFCETGDPVKAIVERGRDYSVIVMADTTRRGFRRFFRTSTAYEVLRRAHNSVMIVR